MTQQPVKEVTLPLLSQLQNDFGRMRQAIYSGMELNSAVAFAIFVGMALTASDFVPLMFGSKWEGAILLCSLLSINTLTITLQDFFYPALMASGGVGSYFLINVWHMVGVLAACLIGIRFGVTALVVGLIINSVVTTIPASLFLRNRIQLDLKEYFKPCIGPACAAVFMAILVILTATVLPSGIPAILRLICKVVVGAAGYIGFMFVLKRNVIVRFVDIFGHVLGVRSIQQLGSVDRTI
jgi:lipopolysaccharide exporter